MTKAVDDNVIGRVAYIPIMYICFTLLILMRLSPLTIVLHTVFTGSYLIFFYEDVKAILGLDLSGLRLSLSVGQDSLVYDFVKTCIENDDTRKIAIFFTINLAFMFVELIYGYISNSLGLISDSFHMLFDCMALFIGLCASYIAKLPSNKQYTYGFGRIETLSGLFNGIFLVFIAFNVFCESIERIFEPQKIETEGLLLVSVAGLGVNMIGLFFFHDHHHAPTEDGHSGCSHDHNHDNENMYGVFLHILADCLGSVGVIISSMLVKYYGMNVADPICSFLISLMILASSVPFIQMTANTLMMKASGPVKRRTNKMRQQFAKIEGVIQCQSVSMWEVTPKKAAVCAAVLVVKDKCNTGTIQDEVSTIMRSNKVRDLTIDLRQQSAVVIPQ